MSDDLFDSFDQEELKRKRDRALRMQEKIIRLMISGRVQGVGYRAWLSAEARNRKISGWVRNRKDGSVEAVFCGPRENVDMLVNACYVGPPVARVSKIRIFPHTERPASGTFSSLPTT